MRKLFFFYSAFCSFSVIAQPPELVVPTGHTGVIYSIGYSPDQKMIISTGDDKKVIIWDAKTGKKLMDFINEDHYLAGSKFSTDQKLIITTPGQTQQINAWNVESKSKSYSCKGTCADISSKTNELIFGTRDGRINIADLKSGQIRRSFEAADTVISAVCVLPASQKLLIGTGRGEIMLTNLISGKIEFRYAGVHRNIFKLVLNHAGDQFASLSADSSLLLWNIQSYEYSKKIFYFGYPVKSASFSHEGSNLLITFDRRKSPVLVNCKSYEIDEKRLIERTWSIAEFKQSGGEIAVLNNGALEMLKLPEYLKIGGSRAFTNPVKSIKFINNKSQFILTSGIAKETLWDFERLSIINHVNSNLFSFNGQPSVEDSFKYVLLKGFYDSVKVMNISTGALVFGKNFYPARITSAGFNPDGDKLLIFLSDSSFRIINIADGSTVYQGKLKDGAVTGYDFSKDGKRYLALINGANKSIAVMEAGTGKILNKIPVAEFMAKPLSLRTAHFNSNNSRIVVFFRYQGSLTPWINVYDVESGKITDSVYVEFGVGFTKFDKNDSALLIGGTEGTLLRYSFLTKRKDRLLKAHSNSINNADYSPGGKYLFTVSTDGTCKIWDPRTMNLIATIVDIDSKEYFALLPNGFYKTTVNGAKMFHYVTKDLKVISFEQLDVKYNRPDKVLEAIGNTDTALLRSYRKAWEKRIKKLGIDTTSFRDGYSVPETDFANRNEIAYDQKKMELTLHIKGKDDTYKLDRLNVWINEVPVYGQRGISILHRTKNDFDTTITVRLSQGENRIETSIFNVNGTESYRMPLLVNYIPVKPEKEMAHFIGIGIDHFADKTHNLQFCTQDIRDLAVKLREKYRSDITIDTLFNENVTIDKVKSLKENLRRTLINDKVIIAYSGHGLLSDSLDYYLSTYSVNFKKPEENGLPYDELENLLDSIPARKKLMLIDACHSGEVDKEEMLAMRRKADSLGLKVSVQVPVAFSDKKNKPTVAGKGGDTESTGEGHLGLNNSFELMQSLFVNVGKSTGATIISAAAGDQYALEGVNNLPNGIFTYCILEAMKSNKPMKVSELKKQVGLRVEEITKGLQKPTSRNETIAVDWELW